MFFDAGRMSSRLLISVMFAFVFMNSDLLLKITKMGRLLLANKIEIKKIGKTTKCTESRPKSN